MILKTGVLEVKSSLKGFKAFGEISKYSPPKAVAIKQPLK